MIHANRWIHATAVVVAVLLLAASSLPSIPSSVRGQTIDLAERVAEAGQAQAQAGDTREGDVPSGLTAGDWASMQDLVRKAQYQFTWQVSDGVWAYHAPNPAHGLSLSLGADGLRAARKGSEGEPLREFALSLAGYGGHAFPTAIAEGGLRGSRERVEYHWSPDVVEWYVNRAEGLEHGLTLAAPPADTDGPTVELTFALGGSLTPELDGGGRGLRLMDAAGSTALLYDQLAVYDAAGRALPARFSLSAAASHRQETGRGEADTLHLTIDATGAAYPVVVDPLLHSEVAKLTASDAQTGDSFGRSVAISGDTIVVGADHEDGGTGDPLSKAGAAYVFTRNYGGADGWGQIRKLTASDAQADDGFGRSVAISGDTIVVGAWAEAGGPGDPASYAGAAYVFERNHGGADNWGQLQKLTALDAASSDLFGYSVAISGDTVIVGAYAEDGGLGEPNSAGSVYLFTRNQGGEDNWGQVTKLTAIDAEHGDQFGHAVAISGDTVVVGADGEDGGGTNRGAAYVFERNRGGGDNWGQVQKLTALAPANSDAFGYSVAISGDTVLVGAFLHNGGGTDRGAAYLFERNQGGADNWGQIQKLTASDAENSDWFGASVAISGDNAVVGAEGEDGGLGSPFPWAGAAYVFERNQGGADHWGQAQKLAASDPGYQDYFGNSVAISGDTVVIGALSQAVGPGDPLNLAGAAYVSVAHGGQWLEVAVPYNSGAEDYDYFGASVAVSGDTVVVGADGEDGGGTDRGAAYVLTRNHGGADWWSVVTKLSASDAQDSDYFGNAVAISGDTVVVGAWFEDGGPGNPLPGAGAAYVFERNQGGADMWGQVTKLTATDAEAWDAYGSSVAISGDTIVVGAYEEDGPLGSLRGAAYVYERNKNGADNWGHVQKLSASDAEDGDRFGLSVTISGDTVVAGAYREDGAGTDRGAAYLFARNQGSRDHWGQIRKLTASDAGNEDRFGYAVAISGDTVAVGAYGEDALGIDRGAAYVFERNQGGADNWGEVQKLTASDAANGDWFGHSVAISGDTVAVGADHEDSVGIDSGAAYLFERNQGGADNWGELTKLTASDAANESYFGASVALCGHTAVVGADRANSGGSLRGAIYVFVLQPFQVYLPLILKSTP